MGVNEGRFRRFLVACVIVGIAGLVAVGIAGTWVTAQTADHTKWVNHTYQVEVAIGRLQSIIEQTETTRRGYLLTSDREFRDSERLSEAQIRPQIDAIEALTRDNPSQTRRIAGLRTRIDDFTKRQDATIAMIDTGNIAKAIAGFSLETSYRRMRGIRDTLEAMGGEERRLLAIRDAAQQSSIRAFYVISIVAGLLVMLVGLAATATILRYTRDLGAARDRLQLLNTDLEGAVVERTADLTRANEEIQRFAYIVSHDLRSPLVNVMGFTAELDTARASLADLVDRATERAPDIVTDEARLAAHEDLPEAIGFIRSSTQKMDRLINAILRLSREGRRTLTPEPLDLAGMAQGIADSLHHVAVERGAEIIVEQPMPSLVGDRVATEQILSNLVENAVKYLSLDRPGRIVISARADGQRRFIDVADNGRGIADNDHARVFDLFRRSGVQDQQGEGIGLAHVRALAYRLGGTINLASTLGKGSTFRVTLPATPIETGPTA